MTQSNYQALVEKWSPILEHDSFAAIKDQHKKAVTATILENTERALLESGDRQLAQSSLLMETPINAAGDGGYGANASAPVAGYDPVLISLVRRAMPNLIAYDIAGVQPMTGPTGLIFAMRSKYANSTAQGSEAFYGEADTDFSGAGTHTNTLPQANTATVATGTGMTTSAAEALGSTGNSFAEMAFSIEKVAVTAKSRALDRKSVV